MSEEVVAIMRAAEKKTFLDCTLGSGGHAKAILEGIPGSRVIGLDVDGESLPRAMTELRSFSGRCSFFQADFTVIPNDLPIDYGSLGGVLVDPGLSLDQLKDADRGFSHTLDGPLDMRKNRAYGVTAAEMLNSLSGEELARLFSDFGEVPKSRSLARRIVERRLNKPLSSTTELRKIVETEFNWQPKRGLLHPAARVFQALRIAVNSELAFLQRFIVAISGRLSSGARMLFLSYHSLEDRLVKREFLCLRQSGRISILKPFPVFPSSEEVRLNPASRSARMRTGVIN